MREVFPKQMVFICMLWKCITLLLLADTQKTKKKFLYYLLEKSMISLKQSDASPGKIGGIGVNHASRYIFNTC